MITFDVYNNDNDNSHPVKVAPHLWRPFWWSWRAKEEESHLDCPDKSFQKSIRDQIFRVTWRTNSRSSAESFVSTPFTATLSIVFLLDDSFRRTPIFELILNRERGLASWVETKSEAESGSKAHKLDFTACHSLRCPRQFVYLPGARTARPKSSPRGL